MSRIQRSSGTVRRTLVLAPSVVLLLGLAVTAACLLLLFGPFYPDYASPGRLLQSRLLSLLGPDAPSFLWHLAYDRYVPVVGAVLAVALALVPWRTAAGRQRNGGGPAGESSASRARDGADGPGLRFSLSTRVTRTERSSALSFAEDGSIVADGDTGELRRSVSDLRLMARAVGIPWHTDYETAGGARAFLEIVRAQHTGPASVLRDDEKGAVPPPGSGIADSAGATAGAGAAAGFTAAHDVSEEQGDPDDDTADPMDGPPSPEPSWSPSYSGSVYTPTTLYSPVRTGREDTHGDEEDER